MTDWIEQKHAEIEMTKAQAKTRRAQGLDAMDQLEKLVRRDVAKWNELNPGYRRTISDVSKSMPTGGFQVRKTSFPPASVKTMLAADSMSIRIECTKIGPEGKEPYTLGNQFDLKPDPKGGPCRTIYSGAPISLEEASRVLLEPIIENMSGSR